MQFELAPDNLLFFITLFFISSVLGTSFLLSYKRTWLNYLNALLFFISGSRFLTEYLLQQAPDYETALFIYNIHLVFGQIFFVATWTLLYYYVRPFKNWKRSKEINWFVGIFILLIPGLLTIYTFLFHDIYILNTEMLNGYWTATVGEGPIMNVYKLYNFVFMGIIFDAALYIYSITSHPEDRIKKIFWPLFPSLSYTSLSLAFISF